MAPLRVSEWCKLPVSLTELCIDTTLRCGQSFRWKKLENDEWSCAMHGRLLSLKQDSSFLHYKATWPETSSLKSDIDTKPDMQTDTSNILLQDIKEDDTEALVHNYFNLKPDLTSLYEQWAAADPNFKKRAPKFTGVRILRQDAWEALIGFICSSNNNIARIGQMIEKICKHYGAYIGTIGEQVFHDFPPPEVLTAPGVEAHLKELGFGYRAKYVAKTAIIVAEKPHGWLESLSNYEGADVKIDPEVLKSGGRPGYRDAHAQLLELQGVGPKVADCVALFGLHWGEAVPVDTHVWQIAVRDYKFGKGKYKSLTPTTYDAIANHFRGLWGLEAGWAHSVLFAADLKTFSERLATKVEVNVEEVKVETEHRDVDLSIVKKEVKVKVEDSVKRVLEEPKTESPREQRAKRRRW